MTHKGAPRNQEPTLCFFPALKLEDTLELGPWVVGHPTTDVQWRSDRFQSLTCALLNSMAGALGSRGPRISIPILWSREDGVDGVSPSDEERVAIESAVKFAALDANDLLLPAPDESPADRENVGLSLVTSENVALYFQPIDEIRGSIAHVVDGLLKSLTIGGHRIGGAPFPLPDGAIPLTFHVRASSELAAAIYKAILAALSTSSNDGVATRNRRIQLAAEWHASAMANSRSVTWEQRIIALKTGFESLLGKSESRECARALRQLFKSTTQSIRDLLPSRDLIWSPDERRDLARIVKNRNGKSKSVIRSEIEDWFMALANARNTIIHGERNTVYEHMIPERPLSWYSGPLFWRGERILREAIKASLGVECLLPGLWKLHECFSGVDFRSDELPPNNSTPSTEVTEPPRALVVLLQELNCPQEALNRITVEKVHGHASASREVALDNSRRARDKWSAKFGAISLFINGAVVADEPWRRAATSLILRT